MPDAITRRMPSPRTTAAADAAPIEACGGALPLACDASRRYVRVTQERADGLVAFDFSIGWPELSVELMLPRAAFEEFCATNRVIRLEPAAAASTPVDKPEETDE
jgi:phenol hydroxylase P0 protein